VMTSRSNRRWDDAAVGSSAPERVDLYGTPVADFIRASGHEHRIQQAGHMSAPDRAEVTAESSCTDGAVHT
jgi:hypothetical protein